MPVLHDNAVIGLLSASYNVTELNHLIFDDLFGGEGFCIIINEDGDIITLDGNSTHQIISYGDNFFDFYSQWTVCGKDSLQTIRDAFQARRMACSNCLSREFKNPAAMLPMLRFF